jgi:hypothetical protein
MIERILGFLITLTPIQVALGLAIVSALLLVVEERRFSLLPLLMQYILVGLLVGPQLYRPLVLIRIGLGFAICLTLWMTGNHVQHQLYNVTSAGGDERYIWRTPLTSDHAMIRFTGMGPTFRLVVMILGSFMAYGAWRTYPIALVPTEINLTGYWLISIGLVLVLTSVDPLRMGFGLLTFINGFEAIYLFLEKSLIVIGLLGVVDLVIALGIVACAESWLEGTKGDKIS